MKKTASILVLVFAFILSANSQQKRKRFQKEKMSVEQASTLAVKKMTLHLELTDAQQKKILPLIKAQMEDRRANMKKFKEHKEKKEKISSDDRYKMANKKLDKQIEFQKEMKSILNKEQYEKFKKVHARKNHMAKKKFLAKKKHMKKRKHKEKEEEEN